MNKILKIFLAMVLTVSMMLEIIPVNIVHADDEGSVVETAETVESPAEDEDDEPAEEPAAPAEPGAEEEGSQPVDEAGEEEENELPAEDAADAVSEEEESELPEEEPVLLNAEAFSEEFTVGDLTVSVSYDAGTVPEGTEVEVASAGEEALNAIREKYGEDVGVYAADISFYFDGERIEPKDYSDKKVSVVLSYDGEAQVSETVHVKELVGEEGEVSYVVNTVDAIVTPVSDTIQVPVYEKKETTEKVNIPYEYTWKETVKKYEEHDIYGDVEVEYEEEVPVYETRDIIREHTEYVTKTREVEKTRIVKARDSAQWRFSPWRGFRYITEKYTTTENYTEPVTVSKVVGKEEVQVGTEIVKKTRIERQVIGKESVEVGTEEVSHTETRYREEEVGTGQYELVVTGYREETISLGQTVSFEADDFSVYAVVANAFANNEQYVVYSGTTALVHIGNALSKETIEVENNEIVRASDNAIWNITSAGAGANTTYRLSFSTGSGWNATTYYLRGRDAEGLDLRNGANNECNWVYDNYTHHMSRGNVYLSFNGTSWGTTTNVNDAATVYIARIQDEPLAEDLTYYYFNADGSSSIAASETAETLTTSWTNVSSLAKAIPGYTFLEARANSKTGDVISQVNNRAYRRVGQTTGAGESLNRIYFIYIRDYVPGEDVIPGLNGPITEKHVEHNSDGTFTIQLDITGVVNEVKHGANVVVVFDRTSSMSGNMSNTDRTMRVNAAISAVGTLVNELHPGDPSVEGQYDIDFALVEFDRNAEIYDFGTAGITGHTSWTKSGTALTTRVGRYQDGANLAASGATPGGGGTNWQAALQATAAVLEDKPDADPTYVIFMTDGEPTIYVGSSSVNNNRSTSDPEYYASVPYATAIVKADYHMYDIFCSSSTTTLLNSLYTESKADSYVMAGTQTALEEAFAQVAQDMIDAIGSSNYGVDDGVPSMGSFDLATVDGVAQLSEARYYINTGDPDEFVEWADAPAATPSDNGVLWDLSSVGTLAGDTVYRVEFEIWPSQAAYDLIADLNNQKIFYDFATYQQYGDGKYTTEEEAVAAGVVITAAQRAQIDKVNDTTYTMKTNTSLSATYKLYGQTIVEDDIDYTADAMDLPTETISVKKLWPENMLDEYGEAVYRTTDGGTATASEIKLTLQREGEDYLEITVSKDGPDGDYTTKDDNWSKNDIYVSNGFMTIEEVKNDQGEIVDRIAHIKETGHDYQIIEPEAFLYYWDLISDVYHPMVINGVATILIYDPDLTIDDVDNINVFAIGKNSDGTARIYYKSTDTSNNTLEASNYRRSNLNLYKVIPSEDETAYFTYTATITDSYSTDDYVWFSAFEPVLNEDGTPVLDDKGKIKGTVVYEDWVISGANPEIKDLEIAEDGSKAHDITYHAADEDHPYAYFSYYWGSGTTLYEVPAVNNDVTAPKYKTGYYYADNGATITFKIKGGWVDESARGWDSFPGWNVRFLNLYHGSTFSFDETDMPNNYDFEKVEANTQWKIMLESNKDWYDIEKDSATGEETGVITGTITEPNNNYKIAYTNKPKPEFYIYHSGSENGDGDLETILMSEVNSDGTFNLFAHAKEGFLYGGYYLDYAGKGDYKDDGVPGTTGVAYTGMNYEWKDPQTVDGTKMKPVAGETYYIKEVPTYYLRNYHQINYVKSTGKLTGFYLISAVDDLNYKESGMFLVTEDQQKAKIVNSLSFQNASTGKVLTLKADVVFKSLGITKEGEYLSYIDLTPTKYFAEGEFTVLPYWTTPDGIDVTGISTRTITISSMTKSGVKKTDN